MNDKFFVIVTGITGTGKTTLSKKLSEYLNIPVINKDSIKEILFDTLGCESREWTLKLGAASFKLLNFFVLKFLEFDKAFIVEGNFDPDFLKKDIESLTKEHNFTPVIIHCSTELNILFDRVTKRDETVERHSGHKVNSIKNIEEFIKKYIDMVNKVPDVDGYTFTIDTTDFDRANFTEVFEKVRNIITKAV